MTRQRGLSYLEVVIASAAILMVFAGVGAALSVDSQTQRILVGQHGPVMKAQRALERVAADLQMAGLQGEDLNGNGILDVGEDTNLNGILDAAWDLADGVLDQPSVRFHTRGDEYDNEGLPTATGIIGDELRYRVLGGRLVREWSRALPGGGVVTGRSILADRVRAIRFSRQGSVITVAVDVDLPAELYANPSRTLETSVRLRN